MSDPRTDYVPDPDAEGLEAMLRGAVESPCSVDRVWERVKASAGGTMRKPGGRAYRWWIMGAAGAAAVVGVVVWLNQGGAPESRQGPGTGRQDVVETLPAYPAPVASGSFVVVDGGMVRRGAEVITGEKPATLTLGGYCHVEMSADTCVRLGGESHAESVQLSRGELLCEVDRGVGAFEVQSAVATVAVHGTKFRTRLLGGVAGNPAPPARLVVGVSSGSVEVKGKWGSTMVGAGQERTFGARGEISESQAPRRASPGVPWTSDGNKGPKGDEIMKMRGMAAWLVGAGLMTLGESGLAQNPGPSVGNPANPGAQVGPQVGGGFVARAPVDISWMAFTNTLTRLNMTPDFTLDKETKTKIQALGKELADAREKFAADHKAELDEVSKQFGKGTREEMTATVKKYQEIWSKAPKGEEYIAKAKAFMTPDQVKALEADGAHLRNTRVNEERSGS